LLLLIYGNLNFHLDYLIPYSCLYFKIPLEICKQRIVVREDHPTIPKGDSGIGIIDSFKSSFVDPSAFEGFMEILNVTNDQDIELAVAKLQSLVDTPKVSSPSRGTPQSPQSEKSPSRGTPLSPQSEKSKPSNYNSFALLDEDQ